MIVLLKKVRFLVNNEMYNLHYGLCSIIIIIGLLNDAVDLKTSFLGLYCIIAIIAQSFPFVLYFFMTIILNIKVHIFFMKRSEEKNTLFYVKNFTKKSWVNYLKQGRFSTYESLFLLEMYINRGVFVRQGKHYRYNEENLDY